MNESIHRIAPIQSIFSDIITAYGTDYVCSGPVFEYFGGENWEKHMAHEIADDRLCGFIGKTVIHPTQIKIVNDGYRVSVKNLEDARSILGWSKDSASMVAAGSGHERMNEHKTHTNWARRIMFLAELYGTYDSAAPSKKVAFPPRADDASKLA
jgi:citrate lyase beta subunit